MEHNTTFLHNQPKSSPVNTVTTTIHRIVVCVTNPYCDATIFMPKWRDTHQHLARFQYVKQQALTRFSETVSSDTVGESSLGTGTSNISCVRSQCRRTCTTCSWLCSYALNWVCSWSTLGWIEEKSTRKIAVSLLTIYFSSKRTLRCFCGGIKFNMHFILIQKKKKKKKIFTASLNTAFSMLQEWSHSVLFHNIARSQPSLTFGLSTFTSVGWKAS